VIFVLHRRADLTREQALAQWSGEQHVAIVGKVPGLTRWVQNHASSAPADPVCDGIGEMWFASDELMNAALDSPEMAEAVEDAKRFLDMERTGLILVEEKTLVRLSELSRRTAATGVSPACRHLRQARGAADLHRRAPVHRRGADAHRAHQRPARGLRSGRRSDPAQLK
jgi:uncharacterized protein (TIGR02118 family)